TAERVPQSMIGVSQFDDAVTILAGRASGTAFKISLRNIQGPSVFDDEGIMVVNFPAARLHLCLGLARADDQGDRVLAKPIQRRAGDIVPISRRVEQCPIEVGEQDQAQTSRSRKWLYHDVSDSDIII